jgi:hypothetical protein
VAGELIIEASPDKLLAHYGVANVEDAFLAAVGASDTTQGLEWLANSSG